MDTGNSGPQGEQKKSSIFAGIIPTPAPPPAPAPPPKPVADTDSAAVLSQKMEALEKNIVSRLEEKIAEQLKAAASALPPLSAAPEERSATQPGGEALLSKISELERRLGDFSRQADLSSSQFRNIEESKISARREIGELLKAVREQQKYTELDRQMHSQLEKSWTRVGELEQKLMNFYASIMALQTEHKEEMASERSAKNDFSAEFRQAMEGLSRRLASLEEKAEAAGKAETAGREAFFEEMKLRAAAAAGSSAENLKESVLSVLKSQVSVEVEATRRQFASELAGIRQENLAQAGLLKEMLKENNDILETGFARSSSAAAQGRMKADELENAFENMTRAFQSLGEKMTAAGKAETVGREASFEGMRSWMVATAGSSMETLKAGVCAFLNVRISEEMESTRLQFASELAGIRQENLAQGGFFREMLKENKIALEAELARLGNSAETLKAGVCAFLNARISEEMESMRRQSGSELAGIRQENLAQGRFFKEILKENTAALEAGFTQFSRSVEAGLVKIDDARTALEETSSVLRARSKSMDDFFLAALKSGTGEHSGFTAGYANALVSQSFLKAFYSALDEVSGALSFLEREAGSFVAGVDKERLEKTVGISGMLLRKYFEAVGRAIGQIKTGSESVERIKLRLNERFKDVSDDRL